ncbi:MT-A70 family methyltransferase [Salipiger sp.]|uniref:MT-A70 family methyltransferase n=1 Tax=Salipiger sp. TaxID=2078585 RepID=UPI003A981F0E
MRDLLCNPSTGHPIAFPDMPQIAREFAEIRPYGGATFIKADPPWKLRDWSENGDKRKTPDHHYKTQPLDWIKALPVSDLAAPSCILFLWATHPMFPQALEVMIAWGFEYSTSGVWVKRTRRGKLAFGGGRRLRSASELFIIATRGKPPVRDRSIRTVIEGLRREHSRKPEEAYEIAEMMDPSHRRVDLFSRCERPGWRSWGDEKTKFNHEESVS